MAVLSEFGVVTFGMICSINAIYNIFPDGDLYPSPQSKDLTQPRPKYSTINQNEKVYSWTCCHDMGFMH